MALTKLPRLFWRIDADRHHLRLACHKLRQLLLKAPQLGVAQRSPVATVENQQYRALTLAQLRECHLFTVGIGEREIRRPLPNLDRGMCRRKIPGCIENAKAEQREYHEAQSAENSTADLSTISFRLRKCPVQPDCEKASGRQEQQQVCPGKVTRARKTGEKRNEAECSEQRDSEADPYKPIPASSHKRSRYVIVAPLDGFLKRTVSETVDAAIVHCPGSVDPEPEGISRQFAKRRGPHGVPRRPPARSRSTRAREILPAIVDTEAVYLRSPLALSGRRVRIS